ncbi:MAG: sulfatase, partial [Pirellulaceae bacterium]
PVMRDKVTLAQHFMQAGYIVRAGGKIFHNSFNDLRSWQHYEPTGRFGHPKQRALEGTSHFDWGAMTGGDDEMGDTHVVDWAIDFLKQPHDKPFFLATGMIRPHLPFYAPQKYFDLYPLASVRRPEVKSDDLADVPPAGVKMARPDGDHKTVVEAGEWEHAVQSYLACISYVDGQIGRLIEALDKSPHANNTIVILWSDHGWHLGEKEHWRKFALWEEATRVTMMAVVPGMTHANQRCDRTVSLLDIYPTLVEVCGLPPREGLEGRSLASLLRDPASPREEPAITTHGKDNHAVRSERWRYIRYADGSEELYDHDADPREWTNVAGEPSYAPAKAQLAKWLPQVNAPDAPSQNEKGRDKAQQGKRKAKKTKATR